MNNKKISKVMHEFKAGSLKSSSGQKVTNPKQGIAIALSEASKARKGSEIKATKPMTKAKATRMLSGVPMSAKIKAMIPGMKKGGSVGASKMGSVMSGGNKPHGEHTVQKSGRTKAKQVTMPGNKNMKKGGKV